MIIVSTDVDQIYFPKTREYFSEVLSSYGNGNYRSAVVMLYSVAICDLLYKLQEISDMYNDKTAQNILKDLSDKDDQFIYSSDSKWEKKLVERISKETFLLDTQAYKNLLHLRDDRNLSAHPALNTNFDLVKPTKEATISHIRNIFDDILVKPPIFIKNIVDLLTEDLAAKSDVYDSNHGQLSLYLKNKYLSKMTVPMYLSTVKAFWKFCFMSSEDAACISNSKINRSALHTMFEFNQNEFLNCIKHSQRNFGVADVVIFKKQLIVFLSKCKGIYALLDSDVQFGLQNQIKNDPNLKLVSWFINEDKIAHLKAIIADEEFFENGIRNAYITYTIETYTNEGLNSLVIDFEIKYFGASKHYDIANDRFEKYISPNLGSFSRDQVLRLFEMINNNPQIHDRRSSKQSNTEIVVKCKNVLGENFDYSSYPNFKFDHSVNESLPIVQDEINTESELV